MNLSQLISFGNNSAVALKDIVGSKIGLLCKPNPNQTHALPSIISYSGILILLCGAYKLCEKKKEKTVLPVQGNVNSVQNTNESLDQHEQNVQDATVGGEEGDGEGEDELGEGLTEGIEEGLLGELGEGLGEELDEEYGEEIGEQFSDDLGEEYNEEYGDEYNEEYGGEYIEKYGDEYGEEYGDDEVNQHDDEEANQYGDEYEEYNILKDDQVTVDQAMEL
ncbi:hypothetical protein PGO_073380 [Plasmodium gonderi]|uniref:Uncharacterized protein n=1 Tax=Plasmodium gonderi TaxID=77519 RepID=A0A1Y1JIZ3_PLAGO|nr:hypothetical protein PGO_073380 [Plasmodium gonderi]GAW80423.1 hypothetical protein PGO_073380 [Plasmodium gonderi]